MQQFLLGMIAILMPSVLFVAWLLWHTSPRSRSTLGPVDVSDPD
jgi:hypothetical protein